MRANDINNLLIMLDQARIVRQVELQVESFAETINGQAVEETFQRQGVRGWLDEIGAWRIEGEVHHGRLRCANYEMGIQLGRGNPACADVDQYSFLITFRYELCCSVDVG